MVIKNAVGRQAYSTLGPIAGPEEQVSLCEGYLLFGP